MTDRQEAKFSMYQKVLNVCNEHKREYVNVPAFANSVDELNQQVTKIQSSYTATNGNESERNN